jgi:hypothetical protein
MRICFVVAKLAQKQSFFRSIDGYASCKLSLGQDLEKFSKNREAFVREKHL